MKMFSIIAAVTLILTGCSKSRSIVEEQPRGSVTLAVSSPENSKSRATKATKLHIRITNGSGTVLADTAQSLSNETSLFSLDQIDGGDNYSATAWTTDETGDTIHAPQTKSFSVVINQQATVILNLTPVCGSIFLELVEVPTSVDSLFLTFSADSGNYGCAKARSAKVALELDKVAYGARGKLKLTMLGKAKDTVASWDTTFTFTNQNISGQFSFLKTGGVSTQITMSDPANTVFTGFGDPTKQIESEVGNLLITEFMATGGSAAASGEFIEIHNPKTVAFRADTMFLSAGDKTYKLPRITIPAGGFYVVAAQAGTFWSADTVIAGLDLVGTSGIISVSSAGIMQDYVIYFNDANLEWPSISSSGKKSWELKSGKLSAGMNNLGSSWQGSSIPDTSADGTIWYGHPKSL